ncbi:hypothetical protein QM467_17860 [Rhodoblastus sp. 17X3]|uniref:hypothetical protein n=1 Tax=Rhodoblastus sp. 17X3 TaxID=3047026 RepID=UPI0024B6F8FF|nr:hypothetical protein [Rhodoblastus sp. 17X3]MDI9849911.1 hypothetical protein [Rhodoblastus sp. 17X3]
MTVRTNETNVTFKRAFSLPELEHPQPPGTYRVLTDEEEIPGLSFLAYRRVATILRLPSLATSGRPEEMISINAAELSAAMAADGEGR